MVVDSVSCHSEKSNDAVQIHVAYDDQNVAERGRNTEEINRKPRAVLSTFLALGLLSRFLAKKN